MYYYVLYVWRCICTKDVSVFVAGKKYDTQPAILKIVSNPGNFALKGFKKVKKIIIGNMVTDIGIRAFSDCSSLVEFEVEPGNQDFSAYNGILYDKKLKKIAAVPAGIEGCFCAAPGIKEILKYAFAGCENLTSIIIPDTVKKIGAGAFYGCLSLESVTLPDSIEIIGAKAFEQCICLQSAVLPSEISELPDSLFKDCASLEAVYHTENIVSFGESVFENCELLNNLRLSDKLTELGTACFKGCTSLETLTMPASLKKIGNNVFVGCASLKSFEIPNNVIMGGGYNFDGCKSLEYIKINNGVHSSLGTYSFKDCDKLKTIVLSDDELSDSAAAVLKNVTVITLTDNNERYCIENGVLYSKDKKELVLVSNKVNGEFIIPDTVEKIGNMCFSMCVRLSSVVFGKNVEYIGKKAFSTCISLSKLEFSGSKLKICSGAFENCKKLKSVIISCDKFEIQTDSFTGSSTINNIDISVNGELNIPENSFAKFNAITAVKLKGNSVKIGASAFSHCKKIGAVTIDTVDLDVGNKAFYLCKALNDLCLSAKSIYIDDYAFYGSSLVDLQIKYGLQPLKETAPKFADLLRQDTHNKYIAFNRCDNEQTPFAADFVNIGALSFAGCSTLTKLHIASRKAVIGSFAFDNNRSLRVIHIPIHTKFNSAPFPRCLQLKACEFYGDKNTLAVSLISDMLETVITALKRYDKDKIYLKSFDFKEIPVREIGYMFINYMYFSELGYEYTNADSNMFKQTGKRLAHLLYDVIIENRYWLDFYIGNNMLSSSDVQGLLEKCSDTELRAYILDKLKFTGLVYGANDDLDDDL